jgi:hypothetical protein
MFGSNGILTSAAQTFGKTEVITPYVLPAVLAIVGIFIVAIIIITIIQLQQSYPARFLKGPVDLFKPNTPVIIDREGTQKNMGGSYTLSYYLKVDAVPDMRSSATPLMTWAGIWNTGYNAANEQLVWTFAETKDSAASGSEGPEIVTLPQVALQRWNQITMTFEGRTVDLYVNGVLTKSATLHNLPQTARSSITLVPGGVLGQIAYVQLWPRRLTVSETKGNYTDTSDSQGRPYLGPAYLQTLNSINLPNLFCPSGDCTGTQVIATASQNWEFPYA